MKDLLITALILLTLIAVLVLQDLDLLPVVSLEQWDTIATIFWAQVPFFLCLLLGVLVKALINLWPAVSVLLTQRAALHEATKAELETRSAMNDALMWQARHAAKAQRTGKLA